MTVRRRNQNDETVQTSAQIEEALASQIDPIEAPANEASQYLGQTLTHAIGSGMKATEPEDNLAERKGLSRIGERIGQTAEIREGWIDVDRGLLGERSIFYPEDWQFRIKPATVEAIRNWSTINDENPNSIDDVFDEILKSCLAIRTNRGPLPWNNVNAWDRFFFVLLIREYTFTRGEQKIQFTEQCSNCEVDVTFELTSQSLMYDLPDEDVMQYYMPEDRVWNIYPADFDVDCAQEVIQLYLPTREKDANIKAWVISKLQENRNAKIDQVFIKFLPWMLPKISKDPGIAKSQINKAYMDFKSWDIDMFSFMNDVINNIVVTPGTRMLATCPSCGEEVTTPIRFPNGISSLFNVANRHKKFGKK